MSDRAFWTIIVMGTVLFLATTIGIVWIAASMEARTFERVTGKRMTTWEAVWVDLRIQAAPDSARDR